MFCMDSIVMKKNKNGFTLIELLIVVSVIGVLSGILLNVINIEKTRGKARDGVRLATMSKLVQALEAYAIAESGYPTVAQVTNLGPTTTLGKYIKEWPAGTPSNSYDYLYRAVLVAGVPTDFYLLVKSDRATNSCFKYFSDTSATSTNGSKILYCTGNPCNAGNNSVASPACNKLD